MLFMIGVIFIMVLVPIVTLTSVAVVFRRFLTSGAISSGNVGRSGFLNRWGNQAW